MRETRSTASENNALSAQSSCSMVHPSTLPRLVLQTCSQDTTLGSAGATEPSHPSDSPRLFWRYQFVTTARVTLKIQSPCWELACEPFDAHHRGHSRSALRCCLFGTAALRSNWYLELLLAALNLLSHPCDLMTSRLAEEVLCDLLTHHIRACCVTSACLTACCVVTPRPAESMLRDLPSCSLLRCHLQSHDFATRRAVTLWHHPTPSQALAACLAAGRGPRARLWESTVSPRRHFKTLSRSLGGIFRLMPKCRRQNVQSQRPVCHQEQ